MIPKIIKINLDGQREIYSDLVLSVGDTNSYGLILEFYNGGTQFDVTGYNLAIMATRSGSTSPIPDTGIIKNGKGYYTIKPAMYAYDGTTKIEVILSDFAGMFYVTKVIYFVVRSGFSSNGGEIASETDYTILSALIAQTQAAISSANGAAEYANSLKVFGTQFTIAPSNAVNKERADLILTGTTDGAAINAAFTALAALRASDDVAVRVDFLGGDITVEESIVIPHNFRIYGNGVTLTAAKTIYIGVVRTKYNCYALIDGINFIGSTNGGVLLSHNGINATVTNCKFSISDFGISNLRTMSITNCSFSNIDRGIESDISGQRINVADCKFYNVLNAIRILAGTYSSITGNRFANSVTTPIYDEGTSTLTANNITEV